MHRAVTSACRRTSRGVTLIEILVGIVIGLIGMLVIFQTISVWDARTRVSTSSGDAQIAGSLAMFNLERDLRLAGMGFGTAGTAELGCTVNAYDNSASAGGANFTLRPVNIVDGDPTGVPDTDRGVLRRLALLREAAAVFRRHREPVDGRAQQVRLQARRRGRDDGHDGQLPPVPDHRRRRSATTTP